MWRVLSTFICLLIGGAELSALPSVQMRLLTNFSQSSSMASARLLILGAHGSALHSAPTRVNLESSLAGANRGQLEPRGSVSRQLRNFFPMTSSLGLSGDLLYHRKRVVVGFALRYHPIPTSLGWYMALEKPTRLNVARVVELSCEPQRLSLWHPHRHLRWSFVH